LDGIVGAIEERIDGVIEPQVVKRLDFVRGSAETGTVQKMRRLLKVPLSGLERSEHDD
jgi:hypothetical protein